MTTFGFKSLDLDHFSVQRATRDTRTHPTILVGPHRRPIARTTYEHDKFQSPPCKKHRDERKTYKYGTARPQSMRLLAFASQGVQQLRQFSTDSHWALAVPLWLQLLRMKGLQGYPNHCVADLNILGIFRCPLFFFTLVHFVILFYRMAWVSCRWVEAAVLLPSYDCVVLLCTHPGGGGVGELDRSVCLKTRKYLVLSSKGKGKRHLH